jgi:DNA-binding transcriptional LysR family regulator
MNIDYLRYFIVISETLNLNIASEKLHITPQALSKAIKTLEDYYNIKLFERNKSIKSLTSEGEYFLDKAINLVNYYQNLELEMKDLSFKTPQGNLLIACDSMCQNYILPDLIHRLLLKYNKITPKIYTMIPSDVEKYILSNEIHIGFISESINNSEFNSKKFTQTESVIVGNFKKNYNWNELNYIVPKLFNRKTISLDGWDDIKFPRKVILEVESLETAIRLCEKGIGVAFLPKIAIEDNLRKKSLFIVSTPPIKYIENIYLVYKKDKRMTLSTKAFLDIIK